MFQYDLTEPEPVASPKRPTAKLYDSDSDLSDTERMILERRRINTEYMEQIEKERQERESLLEKEFASTELDTSKDEVQEPLLIGSLDKKEEMDSKTLEELESERDALLQQVRNPDPPEIQALEVGVKNRFKLQSDSDEENLETRRKKVNKKKEKHFNGDVSLIKRLSESSTGESSPCGQVSPFNHIQHFSLCFF